MRSFWSWALISLFVPLAAQSVSNLSVKSATKQEVDLTWTGTAGTYTVQRSVLGGPFTNIATVNTTSAADTQIDPYTTYQYQVVAGSTTSNQVTVGPPPAGFSVAAPTPGAQTTTDYSNFGLNISATLDRNGDPALIFLYSDPNKDTDYSDSQLLFRSWNRAQYKWNPTVIVGVVGDSSSESEATNSLAYDSSTNTFVAVSELDQRSGLTVWTSADGGATWSKKTTFTADGEIGGPSVAARNGNIYLAYTVSNDGLKYVTGQLSAAASTWQTKTAPQPSGTELPDPADSASLALDSSGTPAIAYWVADSNPGYNIILLYWRPNSSGNPVKVLDSLNNQTDGAVRLVFHNLQPRIMAAVQRNEDFGLTIHFAQSNDGGNTWSEPVAIPPDGNSSTDYPADLAIDSQDHGAIAFGQNSGTGSSVCGNPKLALSTDLVHWTTCAAASTDITGNFDAYPSSIALLYGGNDKLYMFWQQTYDNTTGTGVLMWREPPAGAGSAPSIDTTNGVVNGATFQPGVVAGSWITIKGANFAQVSEDWSKADFGGGVLPTDLSGVEVLVNGTKAAVYYISANQLNVQAPASAVGDVTVQVSANGQFSNIVTVTAVQHSPGLFSYTLAGKTFPAAVFVDGTLVGDQALYGQSRKAKAGDIIQLYATGIDPSPAGSVINAPITSPDQVTVKFGSNTSPAQYAGLVAVGEFQVNMVVPNLPPGDYPISIQVAGLSSQTGVTLSIGQ